MHRPSAEKLWQMPQHCLFQRKQLHLYRLQRRSPRQWRHLQVQESQRLRLRPEGHPRGRNWYALPLSSPQRLRQWATTHTLQLLKHLRLQVRQIRRQSMKPSGMYLMTASADISSLIRRTATRSGILHLSRLPIQRQAHGTSWVSRLSVNNLLVSAFM